MSWSYLVERADKPNFSVGINTYVGCPHLYSSLGRFPDRLVNALAFLLRDPGLNTILKSYCANS